MHPENGPRCALWAFTKASHNRKECGQDIASACKPPHATATVVLCTLSFPNRTFWLTLNFYEERYFFSKHRPYAKRRSASRFNNNSTLLLHSGRIVPSHSSHQLFAFLTSTFHTFPVTHSRHYAAHFLMYEAPARRRAKIYAVSNTFLRRYPFDDTDTYREVKRLLKLWSFNLYFVAARGWAPLDSRIANTTGDADIRLVTEIQWHWRYLHCAKLSRVRCRHETGFFPCGSKSSVSPVRRCDIISKWWWSWCRETLWDSNPTCDTRTEDPRATLDGVRSPGYVSLCMPTRGNRLTSTASLLASYLSSVNHTHSRYVLLHFPMDLLRRRHRPLLPTSRSYPTYSARTIPS